MSEYAPNAVAAFQLSRPVRGVAEYGMALDNIADISTLTPCEGRGCPYISKLCAEFYFFTFNATNYLYLSLLSQSVKVRTSPCFYGCLCFALP